MKSVLVLGGYGNFGKRIAEGLADVEGLTVLIAGRSIERAQSLACRLGRGSKAKFEPVLLDISAAELPSRIREMSPNFLVHTAGPFQGQDYRVAEACIETGIHYADLADDRRFVCDIRQLNEAAEAGGVLAVSGASSVPGLSAAVIDRYRDDFLSIDSLDIAIAPGNRVERGEATVRAILSYTGRPFRVFSRGHHRDAFGWLDVRRVDFGGIAGKRWLANVDVPDLELFPSTYRVVDTVRFQAGLELSVLHLTMAAMAQMAKWGLVRSWAPLTRQIVTASNWVLKLGSDIGAMRVEIRGRDTRSKKKTVRWILYAPNGIGPYIPTFSTLVLAKKLLDGELDVTGAMACTGLLTLADFEPYFRQHGIYCQESHA